MKNENKTDWKTEKKTVRPGLQNGTKTEKIDEIGRLLLSRALNDTIKIRKPGADIFASCGLENGNNLNKSNRNANGSQQIPINPVVPAETSRIQQTAGLHI